MTRMLKWLVGGGTWHTGVRFAVLYLIIALSVVVLEENYALGGGLLVMLGLPIWCVLVAFAPLDGLLFGMREGVAILVLLGTVMWFVIGWAIGAKTSERRKGGHS